VSEQSFRLIVEGIAGLVAIMTSTGELEVVNRQALDYFGKTVEQLKGWLISDAVHPDDLPGVISAWRDFVETVAPYDDGTIFCGHSDKAAVSHSWNARFSKSPFLPGLLRPEVE
jgi:PAS domain-containing protein